MSFGTGFHDIRSIDNCLNDGAQFIHEYKEYLKDSIQIEKEYVKNRLAVINKYKVKQDKRYTLPELTTSHRAWIVFLCNMEKKCEERISLLDKYNNEIIEPLKIILNKEEEEKKKQISFYKKLNTFVERYCQENEKNNIKYHEACDIVMNSKKKCDKKQDKMDKALNDHAENNEKNNNNLTANIVNSTSNSQLPMFTPSSLSTSLPAALPSSYMGGNYEDIMFTDFDDLDVPSTSSTNDKSEKKKLKKVKKILIY